jgi:hypothetical protein
MLAAIGEIGTDQARGGGRGHRSWRCYRNVDQGGRVLAALDALAIALGQVRQWIESVFWTCNGQLWLERHGARTLPGLAARIALRLLALAAGIWHNHNTAPTSTPPRRLRTLITHQPSSS